MPEIYNLRRAMSKIRTYSELRRLETFEERFAYLKLEGAVGRSTFGFDRWLNQRFYQTYEWQSVRRRAILRDNGCDLGILGYEIHADLYVHHMNPIIPEDIRHGNEIIIDINNLITTSLQTHNAIHFGDESLLPRALVVRRPHDTTPWRGGDNG
jgi:hypothetical protein